MNLNRILYLISTANPKRRLINLHVKAICGQAIQLQSKQHSGRWFMMEEEERRENCRRVELGEFLIRSCFYVCIGLIVGESGQENEGGGMNNAFRISGLLTPQAVDYEWR